MNTTENKILLVCPKCHRVALVDRSDYDLKDAIFAETDCHRCLEEGMKEYPTDYYDEKGYMNEREGIWEEKK
jgi:hypothetical protein